MPNSPSGGPPGDDASLTFDEEATPVPGAPGVTFDEEAERQTPPRAAAARATPSGAPSPAPPPPPKPVSGVRPAAPRQGTGAFDSIPGRPSPKLQTGAFDAVSGQGSGLRKAVTRPPTGQAPAHRPSTGSFLPLGDEAPRARPKSGLSPAVPPARPSTGSFLPLGDEPPRGRPRSGTSPVVAAARPATGQAPAFVPGRPATSSGVSPARPGTSTQAALRPATGLAPAFSPQTGSFVPVGSRDEPTLQADPTIDAAALRREVRALALGGAPGAEAKKPATSTQAALKPAAKPVEGKPTDTFVKRKMKEAEGHLADLDFDFPDDT